MMKNNDLKTGQNLHKTVYSIPLGLIVNVGATAKVCTKQTRQVKCGYSTLGTNCTKTTVLKAVHKKTGNDFSNLIIQNRSTWFAGHKQIQ